MKTGNAFSAGLGMAMGLIMAQYMIQMMRPEKVEAKQVIICQRCSSQNPVGNKFCRIDRSIRHLNVLLLPDNV